MVCCLIDERIGDVSQSVPPPDTLTANDRIRDETLNRVISMTPSHDFICENKKNHCHEKKENSIQIHGCVQKKKKKKKVHVINVIPKQGLGGGVGLSHSEAVNRLQNHGTFPTPPKIYPIYRSWLVCRSVPYPVLCIMLSLPPLSFASPESRS